jgi:hypothetical protein
MALTPVVSNAAPWIGERIGRRGPRVPFIDAR